jgi:radical SAM superfamily enzyme YgiQ (UPF0313 family)
MGMRVVLVSAPARESPEALSLGAASVAAAIKASGAAEAVLVDGRVGESAKSLASRIAAAKPEAVGFSTYSWSRDAMRDIAAILRLSSPRTILFAGGPEATADPEGLIQEMGLDFAVAGEGESPVAEAARRRFEPSALRGVPGIALPSEPWKRAPAEKPETLPSPWLLETIDPASCGGDVIWELSRGCPFKCAYCYESKGDSGSRPFPMKRIEAELELFLRSEVRYAFVLDPTFDSDAGRAAAILDLFREKAPLMRWKFELRAELLDKGLAKRFAELDCSLQIGLQSAKASTLATVGRPGFDRREFERKIAMLSRLGVCFGLDLIYGLPGDSLADFEEGLDFALGLGPNHLDLFPLALLPGTALADRGGELGISADSRPPYLVRSTREMSEEDMASAASLAAACDRFYTSGRAVGWFDAALKPLRERPSAFLRGYASQRKGGSSGEEQKVIEAEQLGFLERRYAERGLSSLWPALRDLVRLHGAWGRALAEGEETRLELSYDPEATLGAAEAGLAAFVRGSRREGGSWRVLPDDEEGAHLERG